MGRIPSQVVPHLTAARAVADHEQRSLSWEVNRITRALGTVGGYVVLLKGAAYLLCGLPTVRGRTSSDVDILVPKASVVQVERALLDHGWQHMKLDEYDQRFYRRWSHELPPLQHHARGTVVDVHHAILPPTGRLHPDPEELLAASVPLDGTNLRVLAPADMVLHSAAHAFQDGELRHVLRDLVDLDDLLRHFGAEPGFWSSLIERAAALDLRRPLYYGLRYSERFLETPIPGFVTEACREWRPLWPASRVMDRLVGNALAAVDPMNRKMGVRLSLSVLYMRSHWLRMPPYLLIPHLLRKALVRRQVDDAVGGR